VFSILFTTYSTGLTELSQGKIEVIDLFTLNNDMVFVNTGRVINQITEQFEVLAAESIQWVSRYSLQFDTDNTRAALLPHSQDHEIYLRLNLTPKIKVANGSIWLKKKETQCFGTFEGHQSHIQSVWPVISGECQGLKLKLCMISRKHEIVQ